MTTYKDARREKWLREMQSALLILRPDLAGKLDWSTAIHLFNTGVAPSQAVDLMARVAQTEGEEEKP